MGLNIIAYRVTKSGDDLVASRYEDFDTGRYAGDRDFVLSMAIEWEELVEDPSDLWSRDFCRPKDINAAKEWVRQNITEGNQPRLIKLLEDMEKIPNLYIFCSW